MPPIKTPTHERFVKLLNKANGSDCITFPYLNRAGYGIFNRDGMSVHAHRYAFEIAKGAFQNELCVLHSCDNRACCNPDHLRLGTRAENSREMVEKGRSSPFANRKARVPISPEQKAEIFKRHNAGESTYGIAKSIGRSYCHIAGLIRAAARGTTRKKPAQVIPITTFATAAAQTSKKAA